MRRPAVLTAAHWRGDGFSEGMLLRSVFMILVTASGLMLAFDFRDMMLREGGGIETVAPETIIMEPATEDDQERPYFPKSMPLAPRSSPPKMPGREERVTPKMVGEPMTFALDDAGNMSAVGRIEAGTARAFTDFLKASDNKVKRIWLHSPGGSLADAMAMGRAIRKAKLSTFVPQSAYCASSCPMVFAGGVEREAAKNAWIGVHQVYTIPTERGSLHDGLAQAQRISADCQEYLVEMGVDPQAWIPAMKTLKTKIHIFTQKDLTAYKLVTKPATA
jgi:hypothetical protein